MSLIVIIESSGWFLQWNACIKNTQQILGYCVASHQVKLLLAMLATQSTVLAPLSAIPLLIQLLPNASQESNQWWPRYSGSCSSGNQDGNLGNWLKSWPDLMWLNKWTISPFIFLSISLSLFAFFQIKKIDSLKIKLVTCLTIVLWKFGFGSETIIILFPIVNVGREKHSTCFVLCYVF